MISDFVAKKVLTVGEEYKTPRGGISSVINSYSRHFRVFKFAATYHPLQTKWENIIYFLKRILNICKILIVDKEIQILHIHGSHKGSFYRKLIVLLIAKKIFRKKIIYHIHASYFHLFYKNSNSISKRLIQYFINNVDFIICLSTQWKSFFEDNFTPKQVLILENIVESVEITHEKKSSDFIEILFLGEIGDRKGLFDLLQVIQDNRLYLENKIHLTVGGNGEVKKLINYINDHNLHLTVSYAGWVSGEKKHELLSNCHLFILPSYNEGLPISILEAMSYNLPVISTTVGGICEIIKTDINGFLIIPGDQKDLFRYIKKFVENPLLLEKMGIQSKKIISPYYSDKVISKLESIYKAILNN